MLFTFLFRFLTQRPARNQDSRHRRPKTPCRRSFVPGLEALEDRLTPSTLTVTNLLDTGVSGDGSLRGEIAAAQPGDTINFQSGLSGTLTLTGGELLLSNDLTIDGPGASSLTLSGNSASRVFEITGSTNVTLDSLTIANGQADMGAGIDNAGSLTLSNCTLTNNQAVTPAPSGFVAGGGIFNQAGASLTLENSTLAGNTANASPDTIDALGGGLFNEGSALVTSSTFSGNEALGGHIGFGGGIDNVSGATLNVTDGTFVNNQALGSAGNFGIGGAIENNALFHTPTLPSAPVTATISSSVFTGNEASGVPGNGNGVYGNGGALDNEGPGASMTVSSSTFGLNLSVSGGQSGTLGGAIENNDNGTLTVTNSSFTDNEALGSGSGNSGQGGAILNDGNDNATSTTLVTITNCLFTGNVAGGVAGAEGNGVSSDGGALVNAGVYGTMIVSNCAFLDNQAAGESGTNGVGGVGGGINNDDGGTLTVTNSSFIDNQALGTTPGSSGVGGAIDNETQYGSSSANFVTATITNCTFSGNVAGGSAGVSGYGGALNNQRGFQNLTNASASMTVSNCTLAANSAASNGGGIANENGGSVSVNNSIVANSTSGGDLYLGAGPGSLFTGSYDLSGDGSDLSSFTHSLQGNPLLAPLGDNGGPTIGAPGATQVPQTEALETGSPAIGAGVALAGITTDQRGFSRPASVPDIGAFQTPLVVSSTASLTANATSLTISGFGFDTNLANDTISFSGSATGTVTAVTATQLTVTFQTAPALGNLTAVVTTDGVSSGTATPVATVVAISLQPTTLPDWTVRQAYAQTLTATGGTGPYNFAVTAGKLPTGVLLHSDGTITGTPTTAGTFTFTITATQIAFGKGSQSYTVHIHARPTVGALAQSHGTAGSGFPGTLTIHGGIGPFQITASSGVPAGLTAVVTGTTIHFTGQPSSAGTFRGSITLQDATGASVTRTFSILINPALSFTQASLSNGTVGHAYKQTITTSGGTGTKMFTLLSGQLPAGLSLNKKTGVLSGTPRTSGVHLFIIRVTDAVEATATMLYTLTVAL